MRRATGIELTEDERAWLQAVCRSHTSEARQVLRSQIVLAAAEGRENKELAAKLGVAVKTVSKWRSRFARLRLLGLRDRPGRGRKRTYGPEKVGQIVDTTLTTKPRNATHWSTRKLAEQVNVSAATVWRIWHEHDLSPHVLRPFKLSKDKQFEQKLRDIVGLYVSPPEHAVVLCVDEKSQIQALDRTQPGLPMKKGRNGTWTHDYVRHGTCTLFAALNYLEGKVIQMTTEKHRHQEYLAFLRQIDRETPGKMDLHLIVDNYCTHKHHKVKAWIEKHPRFHIHYTPTSCSWLNLVERFFGQITQDCIRRGVFKSVLELTGAIHEYIENHNEAPKPFRWTKSADTILEKIAPLYAQIHKGT